MIHDKPRVAIQGIRASFHEEAAFKFFGDDIETIECNSFKQTFEALQNKEADYVVMAIENSIARQHPAQLLADDELWLPGGG